MYFGHPHTWLPAIAFLASAAAAHAHSWYDSECCSGIDCAPIPVETVSVETGGWRVEVRMGDHPLLNAPRRYDVEWDSPRIRKSQDGEFHACIAPHNNRLLCLYVPQFGT